jgi:Cu+-exporting ATPase
MISILANNGLYIKNAAVLEEIRKINTLIFDKTGTITNTHQSEINFTGTALSSSSQIAIFSLANLSIHPLSKAIVSYLNSNESFHVSDFKSYDGKGIEGEVLGKKIKLGSQQWLGALSTDDNKFTKVYASINNEIVGFFEIKNKYRNDVLPVLKSLKKNYDLHLLSGDNDAEKNSLADIFDQASTLNFNQLPEQKTNYIADLQAKGKTVMMLGDGLNDANAFEKSNVGVAVIENENNFLPACDVIMQADSLQNLPSILAYVKKSKTILAITFGVSIIYNVIGLSFAMRGMLTPVNAAILMPISTVSVVGLSYILSRYFANKHDLKT